MIVYVVLFEPSTCQWVARKYVDEKLWSETPWDSLESLRRHFEALGKVWINRNLFDPPQILGAYV
jgi:hypothetical protein